MSFALLAGGWSVYGGFAQAFPRVAHIRMGSAFVGPRARSMIERRLVDVELCCERAGPNRERCLAVSMAFSGYCKLHVHVQVYFLKALLYTYSGASDFPSTGQPINLQSTGRLPRLARSRRLYSMSLFITTNTAKRL
jgi:hypothetical protein